MENYPKFELSEKAYINLSILLNEHDEYNCVRFVLGSSCCNKPTVNILLDEIKNTDLIYKYKDISLVYSKELAEKVESIALIYSNSDFMLKFEPTDKSLLASNKTCATCTSKNNNCHNCSH